MDTKEELAAQFEEDLRDIDVLRHNYRDVMCLLWVLGALEGNTVNETVFNVEYEPEESK